MLPSKRIRFRRMDNLGFSSESAGYILALGSLSLVLAVRLSLDNYLGHLAPYSAFHIPVVLTLWLGNWRQSLLAIVLGLLTGSWFFAAPRHSLLVLDSGALLAAVLYLVVALVVLAYGTRMSSKQRLAKANAVHAQAIQIKLEALNRQLETRLSERTASLQETIQRLQHISIRLSQDIRAPVLAIRGFARMLRFDCRERLGTTGHEYLLEIIDAADHLEHLICKMLKDGLVGHSRCLVKMQPVNSAMLLPEIIKSSSRRRPMGARISLQGSLPVVLGDEILFRLCFASLFSEAMSCASPGKMPQLKVWAELKGSRVRFWVEGTNVRVVDVAQGDRSESMNSVGLQDTRKNGVLAIVREVVGQMHGSAGMVSETTTSVRFWLELPRSAQTAFAE
jgi:K+-sensing histidine kinase KdpD